MASAKDSQTDDDGQIYFWSPSGDDNGGSWNLASNWLVGASETPAYAAPGSDDSVFIDTTALTQANPTNVDGTGYSYDLTIGDYVTLAGTFYTQALAVENDNPLQNVTNVASGGSVEAATASIAGSFNISGTVQVSGALIQQGYQEQPGTLFAENGGRLQVGDLEIDNLGHIAVDTSSSIEIGTSTTLGKGFINICAGSVLKMSGSSEISGRLDNNGVIEADSVPNSSLDEANPTALVELSDGTVFGNGIIQIDAGSSLTFSLNDDTPSYPASLSNSGEIHFSGQNSILSLNPGNGNLISADLQDIVGFDQTDRIFLDYFGTSYGYSAGFDEENGNPDIIINETGNNNSDIGGDFLEFDGNSSEAQFQVTTGTDPSTGQLALVITETVACFCPGTLIEAEAGEVPIEALQIGDSVRTAAGLLKPVLWIGRRSYDRRFAIGKASLLPIRIRAGALGEGLPRRDLLVSPKHAMLVQDVLVPAELLVNGVSILQEENQGDVHYLHIELEDHDLLRAEGAAAESFVDDSSSSMFHNSGEYTQLYPNRPSTKPVWCVPCVEDGQKLVAVQGYLNTLAGITPVELLPPVRGYLDDATPDAVRGWAWCAAYPYAPVLLDVLLDGVPVRQVLANRFRHDLAAASIGAGCHSFEFALPETPPGAVIKVRRALDGRALAGLDHAA